MAKPRKPSMHANPVTPFQLAQLAVELARINNHPDPRLHFPKAQQLLISAKSYLTEGISAIAEHAKTRADWALLQTNIPRLSGWAELLPTLAPVISKLSDGGGQVHTREKIAAFIRTNFQAHTEFHGEKGDRGKSPTEGEVMIHHLDLGKLSQDDANRIRRKWLAYRKKRTNKATEARRKNAARKRRAAAEKKSKSSWSRPTVP